MVLLEAAALDSRRFVRFVDKVFSCAFGVFLWRKITSNRKGVTNSMADVVTVHLEQLERCIRVAFAANVPVAI